MKDVILKEIKKKYPTTKFIFIEDDGFLVLLHDNRELRNKEFVKYVVGLSYGKLDENDMSRLSIQYDHLEEIDEYIEYELEQTLKEDKFQLVKKVDTKAEENVGINQFLEQYRWGNYPNCTMVVSKKTSIASQIKQNVSKCLCGYGNYYDNNNCGSLKYNVSDVTL